MSSKGTCSIEGCTKPQRRREWCGMHHQRWIRTGTTDDPPPRVRQYATPAEYQAARRAQDLEGVRAAQVEKSRLFRERHRELLRSRQEERRKRLEADPIVGALYRRAHIARTQVSQAVKAGKLTRPERCSQCDQPGRIEAAHTDYAKPLDVIWLCQKCHRRWDAAHPKVR